MLPLQHSIPFPTFPLLFSLSNPYRKSTSGLGLGWDWKTGPKRNSSRNFRPGTGAVEKDSEFVVDPVQAREALRKLDKQIQSLAGKPDNPSSKVKASDLNGMKEEARSETEISGTFLASLGTSLVIFTIFYNILFLTVIKPSIDGPDTYEAISFDVEIENTSPFEE